MTTNPATVRNIVFNVNNRVGEENCSPTSKLKRVIIRYNMGVKIKGNKTILCSENFKIPSPLFKYLLNT